MKYNQTKFQRLHKEFCEIKGCDAPKEVLHWHHILERTEVNTCNNPYNLAVICPTHHALIHEGRIEVIGVYPSTSRYGRKLIYKIDGVANVEGITEPYFKPMPKQSKIDYLYKEKETI